MNKLFFQITLLISLSSATCFAAFAQQTEKAIDAAPKVSVSFCVATGDVTVHGSERNEVRVWIENGAATDFKVKDRDAQNKPVWLFITNAATTANAKNYDECLRGEKIEVEVPYAASVGIKNPNSSGDSISVDSVAKASIVSINGDVGLRNITDEMEISSLSGSVAATDSTGKIAIKTFGGDIAAYRLRPHDFSDLLKLTSTSGSIVLRDVTHKNIEAVSTNGTLAVYNSLVRGGSYDFNTTNGAITLELPADFPFQLRATMTAGGNFQNNFGIKFNTTSAPSTLR